MNEVVPIRRATGLSGTTAPPRVAFVTHTREYARASLVRSLDGFGFLAIERRHDTATERLVRGFQPELVVVVVDPARTDELDVIRCVRQGSDAPLLVLGPGSGCLGFREALEAGADCCVREGDGASLLLSQLRAMIRRTNVAEEPLRAVVVGDLSLNFDQYEVVRSGEVVPLTPTEFKVLACLAKHAGKVVSPVDIVREAQGFSYNEHEAQQMVKVYVRRIRQKLESGAQPSAYITNVRGWGYMLERRGVGAPGARMAA